MNQQSNAVKQVRKFALKVIKTGEDIPQEIIKSSRDGYNTLKLIHRIEGNEFQEFFYCLFLNRANKATGYYLASMGGVTGTVADPRLIVKAAALADCTTILLSHNHPSGNLQPSQNDRELTQKIKNALSYFDIKVLDHIILTEEDGFYSFADEGII